MVWKFVKMIFFTIIIIILSNSIQENGMWLYSTRIEFDRHLGFTLIGFLSFPKLV